MTGAPQPALPPGACDCHMHVCDDRWPLAPTALARPPHAPVAEYRQVQQALGLSRAVIVQPTAYGFDNRCTLDALAQLGDGARGVVVVTTDASDAALQDLHDAGVRGVRFQMLPGGVLPWDALEPVAARIRPLGWHINLQMDGARFPAFAERLGRLPVPLVVDHNGKYLQPPHPDATEVLALRQLLDGGRCWIKLSAPYETSQSGPPDYADVGALARSFAQHHAERCLWASNWPHLGRAPRPDDASLLALLHDWAGSTQAAHRILVDNPQTVYGFDAAAA